MSNVSAAVQASPQVSVKTINEAGTEQKQQQAPRRQAAAWKSLTSGGIAGAVSRTATAPLERLKILMQMQSLPTSQIRYNGMWDATVQIVRKEGPLAFWRGNATNVIRIAPYSAIGFFTFERLKSIFKQDKPDSAWMRIVAGGMAGGCASAVTYPLDLVRTRLTLQGQTTLVKYNGIFHALGSVVKTEGVFALYKGIGTTLAGIIPYNAINFTTYDTVKHLLEPSGKLSSIQSLWCGAFSGSVAATATYPLDLLRRHMQMRAELGGSAVYAGLWDACKHIFKTEGVRGFFSGLTACYMKVIPSSAIGFMVYDFCRKMFDFR